MRGALRGTVLGLAAALCAGAAMAADLPASMPVKAPFVPPVALYDWNGFYVGGNVGGAVSHASSVTTSLGGVFVTSGSSHETRFTGGGQIGFNYLFSPNLLAGIEADLNGVDFSRSIISPDGSNRHDSKFDMFGTVRGRLGWVANNWLLYGTGGWAYGDGKVTRTQIIAAPGAVPPIPAPAGTVETASNTRQGWAAGAGVEWGFAPAWSAKLEYQHLDFGHATSTFPLANRQETSKLSLDLVRLGVNFHLNPGMSGIVH